MGYQQSAFDLAHPSGAFSDRGFRLGLSNAILCLPAVALFLVLLWAFWFGYEGSDDSLYWLGAGAWLKHFPAVGETQWSVRLPLVLSIAAARHVLGDVQLAIVLPSVLFAVGVMALVASWVNLRAGMAAGILASMLVASNVQLVLWCSSANIDVCELFFVLCGFILFDRGAETRSWTALLLSGVMFGLALLCRETAAFALAAMGVLFLAGFGMSRWRYLVIAAGFAPVILAEAAFYWIFAGDPLHRWKIAAVHDLAINRWVNQGAAVPLVHPLIDPVTMLLLNHNFGLIAWIGVPLTIWMLTRKGLSQGLRRQIVMLSVLALVWSVIAAALWTELPLTPRYFMTPSILVCIIAAIALSRIWSAGRKALAASLSGLILFANVAALGADNTNLRFGEHALVRLAAAHREQIHTDYWTFARARLLLHWRHIDGQATAAPPRPGDLFLFNPQEYKPGDVRPAADWAVVDRFAPKPTLLEAVADALRVRIVPEWVWQRLRGHPGVTLYQVGT